MLHAHPIDSAISLDGVSVAFLLEFAAECSGTLPESATTADVCDEIVKKATESAKCSYTELLKCTGRGHHVRTANVFFSHAWKYQFQLVVKTLAGWCEREKLDPKLCFLWFDILTINQHTGITDFEYWSEGFKQSITTIARVVILFMPWKDAIWLGRAWCLYEYWSVCLGLVRHEFLLTEEDQRDFVDYLKGGGTFQNIVKNVDISKAESGDKEAERRIKSEVKSQVGFATLNEKVTEGMRKWFLESSEKALLDMDESERMVSELYYHTAKMKMDMGLLPDAAEMLLNHLAATAAFGEGHLYHGHLYHARTINCIGRLYSAQGKHSLAIEQFFQALAITKAALGENHPVTAAAINNIGTAYRSQGKHSLAIEQYNQALAIRKAALGDNHPDVADSIHSIGTAYHAQGKYDLAMEQFTQVLAIRRAELGENHPDTAMTIICIGAVYSAYGKHDLAVEQYTRALSIYRAALGECHPDVAMTINKIGTAYCGQGKHDLGIEQYTQALSIYRAALGESHPDAALTIHGIGTAYGDQGKYDLAIEQFTQALAIYRATLGDDNPFTKTTKRNLEICQEKMLLKEAQQQMMLSNVPNQTDSQVNTGALDVAATISGLGAAYSAQGKHDLAIEQYTQALAIQRAALGENHPGTAMTIYNIGTAYHAQGKHALAIEQFTQALAIYRAVLGDNHTFTASILDNIGLTFSAQGKHSLAIEQYTQALAIRRAVLGDDHQDTADGINYIGDAYKNQGKYDLAIEQYTQALAIQRAALGDHPDVAMTINNIGTAYIAQGKHSLAIKQFTQALAIRRAALGESHPSVATTIHGIGTAYGAQGKHNLAIEQFTQALAIFRAALGDDHLYTEMTKRNLEICQEKMLLEEAQQQMMLSYAPNQADSQVNTCAPIDVCDIQGTTDTNCSADFCTGKSYSAQGKYDLAIVQFSKELAIHKESLGESHPYTAEVMHCIGIAYAELGNYELAVEQFSDVLIIQRAVLGESHPHTQSTARNLEFAQQKMLCK